MLLNNTSENPIVSDGSFPYDERNEIEFMKTKIKSEFITRQFMNSKDFEIFYYEDAKQLSVIPHSHDYFELYFFIEGNVDYVIDGNPQKLSFGDFLLIPPGTKHGPVFHNNEIPYRRFVIWIHPEFLDQLTDQWKELRYCFQYSMEQKHYHYPCETVKVHELQGKLIQLINEQKGLSYAHRAEAQLLLGSLLVQLNRIIYEREHQNIYPQETDRYVQICNYIAQNLEEDLSLESLSKQFFLSKYYISHLFKQNIGISPHQFIIKKRLHASQLAILSGVPISKVYLQYGFKDYTCFFKAFKKEYGMSPKDYKGMALLKSYED